jgi:peptidoglycan/xylan/chitin deacetylase (PgdA/CDA1 family)
MNRTGTLILCYHRVAQSVDDPFGLCVRPDNFTSHLDELLRVAEPSMLDDISKPSRKRRVVVTFDDGYADNLWNALPIARAKGVPLTVFVISSKIDDAHGLWWDRLAAILRCRPRAIAELVLPLASGPVTLALGRPDAASDLAAVRSHLWPLPVAEIERVLEGIAELWSVPSDAPPDARTLTSNEFAELVAADTVTIGAHTVDHLRLRGQPPAEQGRSVATSKLALEQRVGRAVDHFAYPYGGHDAFDEFSVTSVRDAGFVTACTTLGGSANAFTDPLRLPRRVAANWERHRFRAQLWRWALW